jgi:hypothetical protein
MSVILSDLISSTASKAITKTLKIGTNREFSKTVYFIVSKSQTDLDLQNRNWKTSCAVTYFTIDTILLLYKP